MTTIGKSDICLRKVTTVGKSYICLRKVTTIGKSYICLRKVTTIGKSYICLRKVTTIGKSDIAAVLSVAGALAGHSPWFLLVMHSRDSSPRIVTAPRHA